MPDSTKSGLEPGPPRMARLPPRVPGPLDFKVVGIGASAGGLEAYTRLLGAVPPSCGMAFILIQHLDPAHESLLTELLAGHVALTILEAADGIPVERDHLYIIPPGSFLAIDQGLLHLKPSPARRGARLPFDYLLQSMARECGIHAIAVVLSGTGSDGSAALAAIKEYGGFVIAQAPGEAGYDAMPRSAIATGAVDRVLPVADMPQAILDHTPPANFRKPADRLAKLEDALPDIIELLRATTSHDFTLYKPGTLQRRIERRMAMGALGMTDMAPYVAMLRNNPDEVEQLAKDLLIHVTSFFRDPAVFDRMAETVVPELIREHSVDRPLRIWVAGCSTGEEAYSLAILFQEQISAMNSSVKLQIFASDADMDAVATARDGLYSAAIEQHVSSARLAAFFTRDDTGYRVRPELRGMIVFTVQDLLADPPFSRLDLVSCRNVMIYLGAEAQQQVIGLFHFALRKGGILLLGKAEVVGEPAGRFEIISKPARLYRHIGQSRPGAVDFAKKAASSVRVPAGMARTVTPSRLAILAELCQRHALETHGPATVLSNRRHECLYTIGPIERYLRVAPGHATLDLLSMVKEGLRTRLRSAILRAIQDNAPVIVSGGEAGQDGSDRAFNVEVHPVLNEGEDLLMIYFVDRPLREQAPATSSADSPRMLELERELHTTRAELQGAVRSLEISGDEQKSINENALSANEEFQSTNEELLTSKEELQSLNEELTALNSQLQETLEQQRTTSNDLQNVLYSTDVATLFLDAELKIRFFTPATKALFNVIKTDVGRPLEDLHSLAADGALTEDARAVLLTLAPIEREIETPAGNWCRRILPYRTHDNAVEGVVITFTDITGQKQAGEALEAAKHDAELANAAKSRFLAAASHDLRQPLQTLALLQGLLASRVEGKVAEKLVGQLNSTVAAMSGMLNTLLDMNQIEAGMVRVETVDFGIDTLLDSLSESFSYHAQAQGLHFRVMPCALSVHSDPRLLERMLRNLVSNALKYTRTGKVLVGCRRNAKSLRIEVWDTGIGIPVAALSAIFAEYHQIDNVARERDRGLGLGLSIVQHLGDLLHHPVRVRSCPGKGSVFSVEVPVAMAPQAPGKQAAQLLLPLPPSLARTVEAAAIPAIHRTGTVLIVEDDPELRELLALMLLDEGHQASAVADGPAALDLLAKHAIHPDLVITDYNLPGGMDGLAVTGKLREMLGSDLPVIILTGDISAKALSAIAAAQCLQLNKPVKADELAQAIQHHLPVSAGAVAGAVVHAAGSRPTPAARGADSHVVFIVDDDQNVRDSIRASLENDGRTVKDYSSCEAFLADYQSGSDGCLLIDAYLPGMCGLELLQHLRAIKDPLPSIMITGSSDVPMAVQAMKAGAADFIEKPISPEDLLASIDRALERSLDTSKLLAWQASAATHVAELTPRQLQIMDMVLAGHPSKNIAADLGISQRTVENHRASIMKTTGTKSIPALARLALAAAASTVAEAKEPVHPADAAEPPAAA